MTATFQTMLSQGIATAGAVRCLAELLVRTMEHVHGRRFRVVIDHEFGIVLIRPA